MSMQNWQHIAVVTRVNSSGEVVYFNSLKEAITASWYFIPQCVKGTLAAYQPSIRYQYVTIFCDGDPFIFRDEMGLTIPPWKLQEVYKSLPAPKQKTFYNSLPTPLFRQGPVPCCSGKRGGSYYRNIRTFAETSVNSFVDFDEELIHHKVKVRGNRSNLPSAWDDRHRCNQRSWKEQRLTQYKA